MASQWLSASTAGDTGSIPGPGTKIPHAINLKKNFFFKQGDFPSGPVVKNLLASAGGTCSIPGLGTKMPHAARQLSPCTTGTEPAPYGLCSATREATAMRSLHAVSKRSPGWAQPENTCVQQRSPDASK